MGVRLAETGRSRNLNETPRPTKMRKTIMAKTARMEKLEALLAIDPDDVLLRYSLAMEHASAGNDAAAVQSFRDLNAASPYVPAYHMAGQALTRLGQVDEACAMLRDGIRVAKETGDTHALGEMEGLLSSIE